MTLRVKHDTAANWTAANPILSAGQFGYETDTGRAKIGDNVLAWSSLAYRFESGGGGGISALTGDVTASGTGSVAATIAAGAVSLSKMANLAASTILGNNTGSPATPIALTAAQVKTLLAIAASDVSGLAAIATSGSASNLSAGTLPAARFDDTAHGARAGGTLHANVVAAGAAGFMTGADKTKLDAITGTNTGDQTITLTGNVTGSGTGSFATTIGTGVVTLAMQANMATASLVYRKTAGSGAPEVNTLATLKTDLGLTGTNSGDQTITLTSDVTGAGTGSFATTIAAGAVTLAKMANLSANSVIGNATGSAAAPTAVALSATSLASSLAYRDANGNTQASNIRQGYTTTATAGATTTLTVTSTYLQFFTGTLAQTVQLPDVTTLVLGHQFYIRNTSTGNVTVNSSGGNAIRILGPGTYAFLTCVLVTGTTAASWSAFYVGGNTADGKVLTVNNSLTLSGTDGTTFTLPSTSGTLPLNTVFTSGANGLAPASGGGTTNFLRADGTWAAAGGGSAITVQDEGSNITTALGTLNFVGAGVTVTGGATAVVTIPGGSGGFDFGMDAAIAGMTLY